MEVGQVGLAAVAGGEHEGVLLVHFVLVLRLGGRLRRGPLQARAALRQRRPTRRPDALLAAAARLLAAPAQRLVLQLLGLCILTKKKNIVNSTSAVIIVSVFLLIVPAEPMDARSTLSLEQLWFEWASSGWNVYTDRAGLWWPFSYAVDIVCGRSLIMARLLCAGARSYCTVS